MYLGGTGTAQDKYQVGDVASFVSMTEELDNANVYFIFTDLVDLEAATSIGGAYYNDGAGWEPKGTDLLPFRGHIDFNGFGFRGLQFNRTGGQNGVWKYANGATFKNGSIHGDIEANDQQLGLLAGVANGCTVEKCKAEGSALNTRGSILELGAFFGRETDCVFTDCSNYATLSSIATPSEPIRLGGFVGFSNRVAVDEHFLRCANYGLINTITSSGVVGPISGAYFGGSYDLRNANCFNDRESSGYPDVDLRSNDEGITNLSTVEAKTLSTYTTGLWSIASLSNYVDETWAIDDGVDYPIHGWAVDKRLSGLIQSNGNPVNGANVDWFSMPSYMGTRTWIVQTETGADGIATMIGNYDNTKGYQGEAVWEEVADSGTADSGTTTTLTDAKTWTVDQFGGVDKKFMLKITAGTNSGEERTIISNTTDTITVDRTFTAAIDNTSVYEVVELKGGLTKYFPPQS